MSERTPSLFRASLLCLAASTLCVGPSFALVPALSKEAKAALEARSMHFLKALHARAVPAGHLKSRRDEFERSYDLFIRYTDGTIYNPGTLKYDKVKLRAYQQKTDKSWDARTDGSAKFQAPAVLLEPGQTVRYKLYNQLPVQIVPGAPPPQVPSIECPPTAFNAPGSLGCFNITNLHSHGLWISPSGNSDNVLLAIEPSVNFEYEYNVPVDHPAGTFWYHPHIHGTTAMQVGSGMTGAMVVYGTRPPTETENGDLDTLLKKFEPVGGSVAEVLMFQQVPYACKVTGTTFDWNCTEGETGVVENFKQVGPGSAWKNSGRYTMINGQVQPTFHMVSKNLYRWRLIDAGFQSSITFGIKKVNDQAQLDKFLTSPEGAVDMDTVCNGIDVTQFEVASDGLTHKKTISKIQNYLQPGYRSDILFSLPEEGYYCVYDNKGTDSLNSAAKKTRMLGVINASRNRDPARKEGSSAAEQTAFLKAQLKAAAQYANPKVQADVLKDLDNGLELTRFVPHQPITQAEITESGQKDIGIRYSFGPKPEENKFWINDKAYEPEVVDQKLLLGAAQAWKLSSDSGSHPHHIHVNPFEIISITNKSDGTPSTDPQYKDMVGTWHDTILVTQDVNVEIRTRYERYIGKYVLHCHILGHEDQGMMQNVEVFIPNSEGKISSGAHGH